MLPKTAGSAQTHKSMSFFWIFWSTLYVYLCLKHKSRPERRQNVLAGTRIYLFTLTLGKFYYTHCTEEKLIKLQALDWKQTENIGETSWTHFFYYDKNRNGKRYTKLQSEKNFAIWSGKLLLFCKALPDIMSGPKVWKIFKIRTVQTLERKFCFFTLLQVSMNCNKILLFGM